MDTKQIVIVQGHPDPKGNHFCHALAHAYVTGAQTSGHNIRVIDIAQLDFPMLRTQAEFSQGEIPESIKQAQEIFESAQHLVIFYPLWLGTMPAYLKAFLEQVSRPSTVPSNTPSEKPWKRLVNIKTAHIVITMGMSEIIYRTYFPAQGMKTLEGNILVFSGIDAIQETVIGSVESIDDKERKHWLEKMELTGHAGL